MASKDLDFQFEYLEKYVGDIKNVKKIINNCDNCGADLIFSHLPDYKNLLVQETARCLECGNGTRKIIHILN